MKYVFLLYVIGLAIFVLETKKRYDEITKNLDEKEYRLKALLGTGLWILDIFKYRFQTKIDEIIESKLTQLYEPKEIRLQHRLFLSTEISAAFVGIGFIFFLLAFNSLDAGTLFTGLLIVGVILFSFYLQLDQKAAKRKLEIQLDFPEFVNRLTLLINAGMNVTTAWKKIASEGNEERFLYKFLKISLIEINGGIPENKALENFSRRCRLQEVTKFVSVLLQNIRKGNNELVSILRLQASECWELRKNTAKRLGEEASTKMLLPMMLMFVAVLIIVAVPAVLSLKSM